MPPCTPERDRQLLSLMWNTANLNRFSAGPLRDAMLMKEDTVGSPPPPRAWLIAELMERWRESVLPVLQRSGRVVEGKGNF